MSDHGPFVELARREGFSPAAAAAAQAAVEARLAARGPAPRRLYCFRSRGGGGPAGDAAGGPPARPRLLLLFPDADSALGFAQRHGLGPSPRLTALTLGQALAAMLQRPAIGALLIVGRDEQQPAAAGLPAGLRVERAELLALLAPVAP